MVECMTDFHIEPAKSASHAPQPYAPPQRCAYCKGPLNPFFYFCPGCGTPYKDLATVLSPDIPRQLTEGELIRMKAPGVWPLFWTYVAVILGSSILSAMFFVEDEPVLGIMLSSGALFITTCVYAAMYWTSLAMQLRQFGFHKAEAWIALAILLPMLGLNWLWMTMWTQLLKDSGVENTIRWEDALPDVLFRVIVIAVFPAIVEEIAFRGLLQHWLQTALKPWRAIILASFLFAVLHGTIAGLPYLFLVGMLLGWAKWKTGSLYPSMLIHFLHNYVVVVFFT